MRRLSLITMSVCSLLVTTASYAADAKGSIGGGRDSGRNNRPDDRNDRDDRGDRDRDERRNSDRDRGYDAALQVCATLRFESDKRVCLDAAKAGALFQAEATVVCKRLQLASDVIQCIRAISKKEFTSAELSTCSNARRSSDVNVCLARAGRPLRDDNRQICDLESAIDKVQNAQDLIKQRNTARAVSVLESAEDELLSCVR